MNAPVVKWYGEYVNAIYPDRSKGVNPRYGISSPFGKYTPCITNKFHLLQVGDVVRILWVRRYGHAATMILTKRNRISFQACEIKTSYSAGRLWTLHPSAELYLATNQMPDERLNELVKQWYD